MADPSNEVAPDSPTVEIRIGTPRPAEQPPAPAAAAPPPAALATSADSSPSDSDLPPITDVTITPCIRRRPAAPSASPPPAPAPAAAAPTAPPPPPAPPAQPAPATPATPPARTWPPREPPERSIRPSEGDIVLSPLPGREPAGSDTLCLRRPKAKSSAPEPSPAPPPEVPAILAWPVCGKCDARLPDSEGLAPCPHCGHRRTTEPAPATKPTPARPSSRKWWAVVAVSIALLVAAGLAAGLFGGLEWFRKPG